MLHVAGLVVAAAGIMIQYVSSVGETLGDPGELGGFAGAAIQIVGLAIALPAGIVAVKRSSRRAGVEGGAR